MKNWERFRRSCVPADPSVSRFYNNLQDTQGLAARRQVNPTLHELWVGLWSSLRPRRRPAFANSLPAKIIFRRGIWERTLRNRESLLVDWVFDAFAEQRLNSLFESRRIDDALMLIRNPAFAINQHG